MQYGEDTAFQFYLNSYGTKKAMLDAASKIQQKGGLETRTFKAIQDARYSFYTFDGRQKSQHLELYCNNKHDSSL